MVEIGLAYEIRVLLARPHVESLTSYMQRVVRLHSVTMPTFVRLVLDSYLAKEKSQEVYNKRSYSVNGFTTIAQKFSSAMNDLTLENNKSELTLLKFKDLFTRNEIEPKRKWCPMCLEDFKQSGGPVYEKLIWSIKILDTCSTHSCSLRSSCPHCNVELKHLRTTSEIGYCNKCKGWLGCTAMQNMQMNEHTKFQQWIHDSLITLFQLADNRVINRNYVADQIITLLTTTLPNSRITIKDFAKYLGKSVRTLNQIIERRTFSFQYEC